MDAYFLFEIKGLCSIALLKFNKGSRENFHSHAFNAFTWFLFGDMMEERFIGKSGQQPIIEHTRYKFGLKPKFTSKENLHRVVAHKTSWCLTIRGRWDKTWMEYNLETDTIQVLEHGRNVIETKKFVG